MRKKIMISIGILVVLGISILGYKLLTTKHENIENQVNIVEENIIDQEKNQTETNTTQENIENLEKIKSLKQEYGITGNDELYFVAEEYDGRKVLAIKPDKSFQVALAGAIKQEAPTFSELDTLLKKEPKKTGIWIELGSQKKWMDMMKRVVGDFYTIDEEGYLISKTTEKKENDYTKKIDEMIQGNQTYMIAIQPTTFVIDIVTGEITENFFEQMDPYQVYENFQNENKKLFVITTNQEQKLTDEEIVNTILERSY